LSAVALGVEGAPVRTQHAEMYTYRFISLKWTWSMSHPAIAVREFVELRTLATGPGFQRFHSLAYNDSLSERYAPSVKTLLTLDRYYK